MFNARLRVPVAVLCAAVVALTPAAASAEPVPTDASAEPVSADGSADPRPATATDDDPVARPGGVSVRVGTWNIKSISFDRRPSRDWRRRKEVIMEQILRERLAVVGIQEAHYGRYSGVNYDDGGTQYLDLVNGLSRKRGDWKVTAKASFNCRNPDTPYQCSPRDRAASADTRIIYNDARLALLDRGSKRYRKQGAYERYLVWARFRVRGTQQRFLFTTTHLMPGSNKIRRKQWKQSIKVTKRLRNGWPVIATGDYNVQKYHPVAKKMLPRMKEAGFGDILNQEYQRNPVRNPRARRMVRAWVNSYNHGSKDVREFSVGRGHNMVGNNLDWIFASNPLPVDKYELVVDYDRRTMRVEGRLPSDHNLMMAIIGLR
jgi:endonuclease/exonuclease/phosphatase family metal-dependent hydrolase